MCATFPNVNECSLGSANRTMSVSVHYSRVCLFASGLSALWFLRCPPVHRLAQILFGESNSSALGQLLTGSTPPYKTHIILLFISLQTRSPGQLFIFTISLLMRDGFISLRWVRVESEIGNSSSETVLKRSRRCYCSV